MGQLQQLMSSSLRLPSSTNGKFTHLYQLQLYPKVGIFGANSASFHPHKLKIPTLNHVSTSSPSSLTYLQRSVSGFRLFCKFSDSDLISQLELGKQPGRLKPKKRANAVIWIVLLNLAIYVADHIFVVGDIKDLYLFHNRPTWYQFVTAAFCHANWNHLSINLFFLYIFGKLVEEEEGSFALWLSYILTGAAANLMSWWVLPRTAISVGASGAVFGLFAISVLVKISGKRRILEVLILGQFVIKKVMEAAQVSANLSNGYNSAYSLHNVSHMANLSGALTGVILAWLFSMVSSGPSEKEVPDMNQMENSTS